MARRARKHRADSGVRAAATNESTLPVPRSRSPTPTTNDDSPDSNPETDVQQQEEDVSTGANADDISIPEVSKSKRKQRSSHIWLPENGSECAVDGVTRWKCHRCPYPSTAVTFSLSTTKNAINHLKLVHHVGPDGPIVDSPSGNQQTIEAAFGRAPPKIVFNTDVFQDMLLQWMVDTNISLRMYEDPSFRTLFAYLAACQPDYSGIDRALPRNGNAIKEEILIWYQAMKLEVKKKLRATSSKIHFSFDVWSGPNQQAYQAIVGHCLDTDGKVHAVLLSLYRFRGTHSGTNLADHLWNTIRDYEIEPFVGMFNVDNSLINDTALVEVARRLRAAGHPSFDPVASRLRCFGHVLNLTVKTILWGTDVETFETDINAVQPELAKLPKWRQKGALGKLHNILAYILNTPERRDDFECVVNRFYPDETVYTVFIGNVTSWSSDYESIQRALRLRDAVDAFVDDAILKDSTGDSDGPDRLFPEDWDFLRCIKQILEPFKEWTLRLQVRDGNGCVADILPTMDELLSHLEDLKIQFHSDEHLLTRINNGWSIMDKYYSKTDLCPGYAVAMALHPNMRFAYFREEWQTRPEWIEQAERTVKEIWKTTYCGYSAAQAIRLHGADSQDLNHHFHDSKLGIRWDRKRLALGLYDTANNDIMDEFQQDPPTRNDVNDVVKYWRMHSGIPQYCDLARMALDYLTIPAMSAEPKQVFSGAKLALSESWCGVGDDAIEAFECLKSWHRAGWAEGSRQDVKEVEEMLHALRERDSE